MDHLAQLFRRIADWLDLATRIVSAMLFAVMIVVVGYEVIMRYWFSTPTFWSSELASWSMVWVALLGFALAFRRMDHIRIDFHLVGLTGSLATVLAVLRYLIVAALAGVLLWQGINLTISGLRQTSPGLGLTYAWLYASAVASSVLMLVFLAELALRRETRPF
ncbi:TRAP transporter small permease [Szabonella alba]|uniref:TRAP transporter small permease protein n=1 Tax=Szabonella alba TaxID=2804194 RepID=A0A8K0Y0E4_9RHOB|nr:TRAP transporter small permease [Szabonella alba]MBL4916742.1 TRAP transporter small permease [Szabonella alba]